MTEQQESRLFELFRELFELKALAREWPLDDVRRWMLSPRALSISKEISTICKDVKTHEY